MTTSTFNLTAAQTRFAEEHGAVAMMEGDGGSVFFYRQDELRVHRWIVDRGGRVRDEADFRRRPAGDAADREEAPPIRASDSRVAA